jgi:putative ABC transport system substrate-binding protein
VRRRDFITLVGGAAAAWPLAARAQQAGTLPTIGGAGAQKGKLPTIGFLGANTRAVQELWTATFVQRLGELGWIEGRTVAIEFRWSEGHFERSPQFFAEFIRLKVDVIVTHNTKNVIAAKRATSIIPIVFATLQDPVGNNIVASLAHPGGNVTGLSNEAPDLVGKRLGLLRDVIPNLRRLGILANASNPAAPLETDKVEVAARTLGLEVATPDIRRAEDIAPAIEALKGRAEAIYIQTDSLFNNNRVQPAFTG